MPRISHGDVVLLEKVTSALMAVDEINASTNLPFSFAKALDLTRFDYLFPELQLDPANRLPESTGTVQALKELGLTMNEPIDSTTPDSGIPSAYTYFGQFVDHDINLLVMPKDVKLSDPAFAPL